METTAVVGIIIAAVVVIVIVAVVTWVLVRKRNEHRRVEAAGIRANAAEQSIVIGQQEAVADKSAAKARVAEEEADAAVGHAERLQGREHAQRSEAVAARDELNAELARADRIDPDS
jgi:uncharacterized iron-regulated membrane protein